ncbi:hypothetical protein HQ531_10220 [bacterium]|nr:hypothetical protein [bacterium]
MTLSESSGQRKISAIMFTDIVGYSKMMTMDEQNAFRLLEIHDDICEKLIAGRNGRLVKKIGDSIFAEFSSSLDASQCAIEIQNELKTYNSDKNAEDQIWVKIGIHVGDVVEKDGDLFGEGINVASRIQPLAERGGICISNEVFRSIQNRKEILAASLGHYELKNILEKWNIYKLFTSEEEYHSWAELTYSEKLKAERKTRIFRSLSIALIVITILLINIPILKQTYVSFIHNKSLDKLFVNLEGMVDEMEINEVTPRRAKEGVYLSITSDYLFSAGLDYDREQQTILDSLINYINSFDGFVSLNGHSDNVPIRTQIFPSNYELTGYRTSFFLRNMLVNGLDYESGNISTLFWGDKLPYNALDFEGMPTQEQIELFNQTPQDRATNRRIDIYFYY